MKILLIIILIGGIGYAGYILLKSETGEQASNFVFDQQSLDTKNAVEPDLAILRAKEVYQIAVQSGDDLTNGPCLTDNLIKGWVLDIAHTPRLEVDDRPENQCSAYLDGTAKHFVELDVQGNLIRAE